MPVYLSCPSPYCQDEYEKKKGSKSSRKEEKVDVTDWGDGDDAEASAPPLFCARCFSLTNYGRVKNEVAESRLPDFDIGKKVGQKIRLRRFRRSGLHPWQPVRILPATDAPREAPLMRRERTSRRRYSL